MNVSSVNLNICKRNRDWFNDFFMFEELRMFSQHPPHPSSGVTVLPGLSSFNATRQIS